MLQPNPIYQHLTRHRKPPSVTVTILIAAALSAIVTAVSLASLMLYEIAFIYRTPQILGGRIILSSLVVGILSPAVSVIVSAQTAASASNAEHVKLIKLTGLPRRTIVMGFVKASLFHLRFLWAACYALLPPCCIAITSFLYSISQTNLYNPAPMQEFIEAVLIAYAIIFASGVIGSGANWLSICAGIWAATGYRDRSAAAGASFFIALIQILLCPTVFGFMVMLSTLMQFFGMIAALAIFVIVAVGVGNSLLKSAERAF